MKQTRRIRLACYAVNVTMSTLAVLSPVLFLTFHEMYDISYTLLGTLVLINFCTQLCIDLIFSFFSHRFNIQLTVRVLPLVTIAGLAVYALLPMLFPECAYLFLSLGTVVTSVSAGLAEVLISPVIAALPSDNPERDMSRLHSVYAWGVAAVVPLDALYLYFVPRESWYFLPLLWMLIPLAAFILFLSSELPELKTEQSTRAAAGLFRNPLVPLSVLCIFMGGAAENTMTQWISGYLEAAMGLDKLWGDLCGTALFAVMLGLGRSLYTRFGRRIDRVLLWGFVGSAVCYLICAVSPNVIVCVCACVLTGFCVSMLWPGTLIRTAELLPDAGVTVYALLAAGGDLGGSAAPQLVGGITDLVAARGWFAFLADTPEQAGFRAGMLFSVVFPVLGMITVLTVKATLRRREKAANK